MYRNELQEKKKCIEMNYKKRNNRIEKKKNIKERKTDESK